MTTYILVAFILFLCVVVGALLRIPDTHGGSSGYVAGMSVCR